MNTIVAMLAALSLSVLSWFTLSASDRLLGDDLNPRSATRNTKHN
jgi:hypothetical protein